MSKSTVVYPSLPGVAAATASPQKYQKKSIPKALKQQVWLHHVGQHFSSRCKTPWCSNIITVFDYHTSHIIPESGGGATNLNNLIPLCANCNLSMGTMTFTEWSRMAAGKQRKKWWMWCVCA